MVLRDFRGASESRGRVLFGSVGYNEPGAQAARRMRTGEIGYSSSGKREWRSSYSSCATLLFVCLMGGCADKPALSVELVTSIVSGAQFSAVEADLLAARSDDGADRPLQHFERSVGLGEDFTRGTSIAAFDHLESVAYRVRVRLLRADRRVLIQRVVALTVDGDFVLRVHVTPNCVGVSCPGAGVAGSLTECLGGECVDPRCTVATPEYCTGVAFCTAASDCAAQSGCASSVCLDGVCASAPMQGACTSPEFCNPTTSMCEDLPELFTEMDAGIDGSVVDAGVDAPPTLECGTACVDPSSVCRVGIVDCSGASPVCATTIVRAGFSCGTHEVCSVTGSCVACEEGMACDTDDCRRGALHCGLGVPTCLAESDAAASAPGTLCTQGCTDGFCPSLRVCDPVGNCSACNEGTACTVGCDNGHIDCSMGGVCVSDGTHLAPLTSCAAGHYCDAFGACEECVEGANFDSENGCMHATITGCASFANVTMEAPGTSCSDGICSGDGRCIADDGLHALSIAPGLSALGHACVVVPPLAEVWCWGSNRYGQLGWGSPEEPPQYVKVQVLGLRDVVQVVVSYQSSCALTASGEVWCWGSNSLGELGDGTFVHATAPVRTLLPAPARDIAVSAESGVAVLVDGRVFEWGHTYASHFDVTPRAPVPYEVVGIDDAVDAAVAGHSATGQASCVARANGHVTCWGNGNEFPLGDGVDRISGHLPVLVDATGIDDAQSIEMAHGGAIACVVRASGELWCWGAPVYRYPGALGDSGLTVSLVPVRASDLPFSDVVQVAPYPDGACVLRVGGEVWCFGAIESYAELGRGAAPSPTPSIPMRVVNLDHSVAIRSGDHSMCAIRDTGLAVCWGDAQSDALGIGVPALVPAVRPVAVEALP